MKKKLFTKVVVGIIVATLLTACGSNSKNNDVSSETPTSTQKESVTINQAENDSTSKEETTKPSTEAPTQKPTEQATQAPTQKPTEVPTQKPTEKPTQPAHTHSWSQATCTSPATCGCGATNGSALGHNWAQATCTSPSTCSRCGATNGSALGHNFGNNNKTCSNCGVNNPNYQAPHTHNWSTKSWTTTEETQELVDGRCCGGCGEWFATDAELTAHQEATAEASRQWAKDHPGATPQDAYAAGKIEHTGWASSGRCVTKTVTVTHHKRVCSCGAEEVID